MEAEVARVRKAFHAKLSEQALTIDASGIVSLADKDSAASRAISSALFSLVVKSPKTGLKIKGQSAGKLFESAVEDFVSASILMTRHLRPGSYEVFRTGSITAFQQFEHLSVIDSLAKSNAELRAAIGSDYLVKPDVFVGRWPEPDEIINQQKTLIDGALTKASGLRRANRSKPLLTASISCKWTLRSDRAQNARTEALNLLKNRKGSTPTICIVTAEPMPSRLASLAFGTGEIDMVYHFALPELRAAVVQTGDETSLELLDMMIQGDRLRDVSDLTLDLAV